MKETKVGLPLMTMRTDRSDYAALWNRSQSNSCAV